jgi:hypothetical protein
VQQSLSSSTVPDIGNPGWKEDTVGLFGRNKKSNNDGWIQWPTLEETKQSSPAERQGVPASTGIVKKNGRIVMVTFRLRHEGIELSVDGTRVCEDADLDSSAFAPVIRQLESIGLSATARARYDHRSPPWLWLLGEPELRPDDAPFLPPFEVANIEIATSEAGRLDEELGSPGKAKKVEQTGELFNDGGRTWLVLDGRTVGALEHGPRPYVDQVKKAGFPASCHTIVHRWHDDRGLTISVHVPDGHRSWDEP